MMRTYEQNLFILEPFLEKIQNVLAFEARKKSILLGKKIQCVKELGMVKDNNDFIKVTKALNLFGIGVVPYEYKFYRYKFTFASYKGFIDIDTTYIIYININISGKYILRVGLHEFIHLLKYLYPGIYGNLLYLVNQDKSYIQFCKSEVNIKLLKDANCTEVECEDESLANFFTFDPDNREIPFAFFYKINTKGYIINLPTTPYNQQKYFDILWSVVESIRG